ncbi:MULTISPECIES: YchJ family protein [Corynebacterium]|nr:MULTISPECIES: YchJ family metal-binding protein [Corynebacterium]
MGASRQQAGWRDLCPCGQGLPYEACCGRYISGGSNAPTAEALMRSRFTAYVRGAGDYVASTWAEETRPADLAVDASGEPFTQLQILDTAGGGPFDAQGVVEFAAHYPGGVMRERSHFERRAGRWVYVDGVIR